MIYLRHPIRPVALAAVLAMAHSALNAAPVDLSPPRNALGAADENGYVRHVQRFGDLYFSDNFTIPLRFDFSSKRAVDGTKSDFGWHGWQCGAIESKAVFLDGGRLLRIDLLCAKTMMLGRDPGDPALYRTTDGAWTGVVEGDRIRIEREDGWSLQFLSGRVDRFRTDKGRWILWERDAGGRLEAVREEGAADPSLALEWEEGRVSRIVVDRADLSLAYEDDTLASISWQMPDRAAAPCLSVQKPGSLTFVTPTFDTYRYLWDAGTGLVRNDGLHTYSLLSGSLPGGSAVSRRLVMKSPDGSTESYVLGSAYGESIVTTPGGREVRTVRVESDGPDNGGIARVEWVRPGQAPLVLMANIYDGKGKVSRRLWAGEPRKLAGYRGGRIDDALDPDRGMGYDRADLDRVGEDTPVSMIEFAYGDSGALATASVDGKPAVEFRYDGEERLVEVRSEGRFRISNRYLPDGGREETVEIDEAGGHPFWYLESADPGVGPDLAMRRSYDADGRLLGETLADGRLRTIEYDDRMRRIRETVVARDGKTPVESVAYVHEPGSDRVLRIREDLLAGTVEHSEIGAHSIGQPVRGRYLASEVAQLRLVGADAPSGSPAPGKKTSPDAKTPQ